METSSTTPDNLDVVTAALLSRQSLLVSALRPILPEHALLWEPEDTIPYECDGLAAYRRMPLAVALPETEDQVAQILKVRANLGMKRQIFFVSQGGYDTHSNQLVQQLGLYAELAGALSAFDNATIELGLDGKVVTFTESEFGRTLQPSSAGGSDHAWGGHQLVLGGSLRSADVHGTFPQLAIDGPDDVSKRGVWLPSTSLDQYAATMASWFGVPDSALKSVFPNLSNFATAKLGFLG